MESLETASVSLRTANTMVDDIYQVLRSLSGVANLSFRYKGKQVCFLILHLYILLIMFET
jgi:hypothetical protein